MTGKTNILLFGATGYIGGAVLNRLLQHPNADKFDITAPVRSPEKAKLLEQLGVKTEIASLSDHDKIESLASRAHVIINVANSDDLPAIIALLKGVRKAYETTGKPPILIHTVKPAEGKYATETVYSDLNIDQLKAIPPTAFHRDVDLAVIAQTSKIPAIIKASLDRKRSGVVGPGKAIWPHVHVDDSAGDMYTVLFDAITTNPQSAGHGWEGYYFGENGEVTWYEIGKAIGQALVHLGLADSAEPSPSPTKSWPSTGARGASSAGPAGSFSGTTCRCRADRIRALGWKPKYSSADLLAVIKLETELHWKLAQEKGAVDFSYELGRTMLLQNAIESS
ncbi:uncharacterized protein B0H18DRAFT_1117482 [Fomitopsis serialis]|uniref:uncharacterized protein n=1 Tax=Fomitopsis serialis TaxID=139415 RepID=UPI002007F7FD|nr:uncharacterized protein B0H18DRAFT_1117482 [Neoantrodia serialis]KAH9929452.1 hypothetical protein B0H18DRAFT_1117482 [Neoantrodia serialis]